MGTFAGVLGVMANTGLTQPFFGGPVAMVLCPEHAEFMGRAGYKKKDVQHASVRTGNVAALASGCVARMASPYAATRSGSRVREFCAAYDYVASQSLSPDGKLRLTVKFESLYLRPIAAPQQVHQTSNVRDVLHVAHHLLRLPKTSFARRIFDARRTACCTFRHRNLRPPSKAIVWPVTKRARRARCKDLGSVSLTWR